jgi:anaerobic selenocysteine-containing dehydrogenase
MCGLVADVDGDRVVRLRADADHPLSAGYACKKGLAFHGAHHADWRLLRPRLRSNPTQSWGDVPWQEALATTSSTLRRLIADHGPNAVGVFQGNAVAPNLGAILGVAAFTDGIGTHRNYASLTLDNSEMFVVAEEVFGNAMSTFVADYDNSDLIIIVGSDPISSQPSQAQSNPAGVRSIAKAAREGRLVVVDPRRSATARLATTHLQTRPGSDIWLLTWLLRSILTDTAKHSDLLQALPTVNRREVAHRCGLTKEQLDQLRRRVMTARRPLFWSGLGVLLGAHGTVGWWLTVCLQVVTGGLEAPGGWQSHRNGFDVARWFSLAGLRGRHPVRRSGCGKFPAIMGTLPASTLADDILDRDEPLRALVVVGGNPAISLPNSARAHRALTSLEYLCVLDLRMSETAEMAHAVLPVCSWLARDDLAIHLASQRPGGAVEAAPAVVPPRGSARTDYAILCDLVRACGKPAFGSRWVDGLLRATNAHPNRIAKLALAVDQRLPRKPFTPKLVIPEFVAALTTALAEPLASGPRLVTSVRPPQTMNSWLHEGRNPPRPTAHSATLAAAGLVGGQACQITTEAGTIEVVVDADDTLHPDAVVVPFGWGDVNTNANRLIGTDRLEPFTGQPVSNGQATRLSSTKGAKPSNQG